MTNQIPVAFRCLMCILVLKFKLKEWFDILGNRLIHLFPEDSMRSQIPLSCLSGKYNQRPVRLAQHQEYTRVNSKIAWLYMTSSNLFITVRLTGNQRTPQGVTASHQEIAQIKQTQLKRVSGENSIEVVTIIRVKCVNICTREGRNTLFGQLRKVQFMTKSIFKKLVL